MRESVRISPLIGLEGARYAEDAEGGKITMRGGFNTRVLDGEWWSDLGNGAAGSTLGSLPWFWLLDVDHTRPIIASPWYALELRTAAAGTVQAAYSPAFPDRSLTFTNGSASVTASTSEWLNDYLVLCQVTTAGGFPSQRWTCYRVLSGGGTTSLTLDRNWEGESGTFSSQPVAPFTSFDSANIQQFGIGLERKCGATIVDQLVDHAVDELYSGSPATEAGARYLIVTRSDSGGGKVFAVNLDTEAAPLTDWFRDTSVVAPSAIAGPRYCATHSNRVVMAYAGDPDGKFPERTIWYSWAGDFLQWHAGQRGFVAAPNYVTFDGHENSISAVDTLGSALIVHRQRSQVLGATTGSGTAPYSFQETNEGYGALVGGLLAKSESYHFVMSQDGPAMFDGQRMLPVLPELRHHYADLGLWGECDFIYHDFERRRVVWQSTQRVVSGNTRHSLANQPASANYNASVAGGAAGLSYGGFGPAFVYDYGRQQGWFDDQPLLSGAGVYGAQTQYTMRADGRLLRVNNEHTEPAFTPEGGTVIPSWVVDSMVETPWMGFGSLERKQITKILLDMRTWTDGELSSGGNTVHLCRLEILTNGDAGTVLQSFDVTKDYTEMQAIPNDENNQPGLMQFQLSPRVSGQTFKFRFRNNLPGSNDKGIFRIAAMEVFFDQQRSTRPLKTAN